MRIWWACILFASCATQTNEDKISIIEENNKAVGIYLPPSVYSNVKNAETKISVFRTGEKNNTAILGKLSAEASGHRFTPAIPLSPGSAYLITAGQDTIGSIAVPLPPADQAPSLTAISPATDSVPLNLLKIYLHFSSPMQESESGKYITIRNAQGKELTNVFLHLDQELWNTDRTMLTLWLNPGRIKRDLQPNLKEGPPLEESKQYTIYVSKDWRGANGLTLKQPVTKTFFTIPRDTISPDTDKWRTSIPKKETMQPLVIRPGENLDMVVLQNAVEIIDEKNAVVAGKFSHDIKERELYFRPENPWLPGKYTIIVQSKAEDLAGNNLERLFDEDISQKKPRAQRTQGVISFKVDNY